MTNRSIGELIDELYEIREERRDLSTQDKELNARYRDIEGQVLKMLDKAHLEGGRGSLATASVSQTIVPSVTDWTKLTRFIKREGAFHLFERRLAKGAWIEAVELRKGRELPGVEAFEKTNLNLTKR